MENNLLELGSDSLALNEGPLASRGGSYSPFIKNRIFSLGLFKDSIETFNTINFKFSNQAFQSDFSSSFQIDFDDGQGYRVARPGNAYYVRYTTEGTKTVRMTDGTHTATATFTYKRPETYGEPNYTLTGTASKTYSGTHARYEAAVYLGCGNVLDKPVIVLEGFDVLDDKSTADLFEDFSSTIPQNGLFTNLYPALYGLGYDLIFVNLKDNHTYIQDNAYALEQLLSTINHIKSGSHKSSVIGLSMSGLVAQWALKDMEDRGIPHQVENYFSYDSPHQGANVAMGMQGTFYFLYQDFFPIRKGKFKKTYDAFNSPAARQMLIYRFYGQENIFDPLRQQFAQQLLNKGYPQLTHNYGISLGRGDGVGFPNSYLGQSMLNATINLIFYQVHVSANVQPSAQTSKKVCAVVGTFSGIPITRSSLEFSPSVNYEISPGGTQNIQQQLANGLKSSLFLIPRQIMDDPI